MREVFEKIYDHHHWYDAESRSGPGSNLNQTKTIRSLIPGLLRHLGVKSILDLPCGDFNWMKEVDLTPFEYAGADIVQAVVKENERRYSSLQRKFFWADITSSILPMADLVFCRDCLVHLSNRDTLLAIRNLKKSGSRYLLTTTFTNRVNIDIDSGDWRPINLQSLPFNFSTPLQLLNENCTEDDGIYADKSLGLWLIDQLPDF
jgi:SAM-dependent methyltransferase